MTMTMAGGVGGGPGTWNIYIYTFVTVVLVDPIMTPIILSREPVSFWTLDTLPVQPGGVTWRSKGSLYPKAHFREFCKWGFNVFKPNIT